MCNFRNGERNINYNGKKMVIHSTNQDDTVNIIFDDNTTASNVSYYRFKHGNVRKTDPDAPESLIGEIGTDIIGSPIRIIEAVSKSDLTIVYTETGDIVSHVSYADFLAGAVSVSYEKDHINALLSYNNVLSEKESTIRVKRELTYRNTRELLSIYRRCCVIRPCSFGKTVMGIRLCEEDEYKNCLYLSPFARNPFISRSDFPKNKKIIFRTYNWLRSLSDDELKAMDYDLVIFDECHAIGGADNEKSKSSDEGVGAYKTYIAVQKMMMWNPKANYVGFTATPYRMDGIDVIKNVFLGHTVFPYTDEDAMNDGLLKTPYYKFIEYNIVERIINDASSKYGKNLVERCISRNEMLKYLHKKQDMLDAIDSENMSKEIKDACTEILPTTEYMRFIVFYPTIDEIEKNKSRIEDYFRDAFPNHKIVSTKIHSLSKITMQEVDNLPVEPNRIDLIFNCEMLCMGYHSEYVNGLVIDRKTRSLTKYQQMIGRLLSCDNDDPVIIFDLKDNLHQDYNIHLEKKENIPVVKVTTPGIEDALSYVDIIKKYPSGKDWSKPIIKKKKTDTGTGGSSTDTGTGEDSTGNGTGGEPPVKPKPERKRSFETAMLDTLSTMLKGSNLSSTEQRLTYDRAKDIIIKKEFDSIGYDILVDKNISKEELSDSASAIIEHIKEMVSDKDLSEEKDLIEKHHSTYKYYDGRAWKLKSATLSLSNKDELINLLIKKPVEDMILKIIDKYHTYPGCTDILSYEDLAKEKTKKNSFRLKMLKAVSEDLYQCPYERIVEYMIKHSA